MTQRISRRSLLAAGALLSGCLASQVNAQAAGNAMLKIMVPFPAGGMADFIGRLLADKLKEEMARTVIVDNRPGAGLRLAAEVLKNSPADGNTILITPMDPITLAPMIYDSLRYAVKDFRPVTDVVGVQFGLAVKGSSPIKSVEQLVQAARNDPKQGSIGITATGTGLHFLAIEMMSRTKINGTVVPYRGGPAMVADLLGDSLPAGMDATVTLADHHRAGKLRVLAVAGNKRADSLPDVPTFGELGYPDLILTGRYMVFVPAATPATEVHRLNLALRKVLAMPDVRQKIAHAGFDLVTGSTPEDAARLLAENVTRWSPVVKASEFKGE